MDYKELSDRVSELAKLDGLGDRAQPASIGRALNNRYRIMVKDSRSLYTVDNSSYVTVAGQSRYEMTGNEWAEVTRVRVNGTWLSFVSVDSMTTWDPDFEDAVNGTPSRWWWEGINTIRLHPPPDTSGIAIEVSGYRAPDGMTSPTDTPIIPEEYHEALAEGAYAFLIKGIAVGDLVGRYNAMQGAFDGAAKELKTLMLRRRLAGSARHTVGPDREIVRN